MNIKLSENQKNKIQKENKWMIYEKYKKKLSYKYRSDDYEQAIKLLCKKMKI